MSLVSRNDTLEEHISAIPKRLPYYFDGYYRITIKWFMSNTGQWFISNDLGFWLREIDRVDRWLRLWKRVNSHHPQASPFNFNGFHYLQPWGALKRFASFTVRKWRLSQRELPLNQIPLSFKASPGGNPLLINTLDRWWRIWIAP